MESLVQRSRLGEFDAVGIGTHSEVFQNCGKLWECYRFRMRESGTMGTRDAQKSEKSQTHPQKSQTQPDNLIAQVLCKLFGWKFFHPVESRNVQYHFHY